MKINTIILKTTLLAFAVLVFSYFFVAPQPSSYGSSIAHADDPKLTTKDKKEGYHDICGRGEKAVKTKFDFDCLGNEGPDSDSFGAIQDLIYAFVRFMSIGVGIVLVLSIILAGIQYSSSMGMPETTAKAKNRIQHTLIGLFIYIFTFAILQYMIPGGIFNPT